MDTETMELYKRMPVNGYKNIGYYHGELCSNCGQNEYENMSRTIRKKKMKNYEKHCPSCHCSSERRRFSSPCRPRTSEQVEAMLNQYERISSDPISAVIKKSQSSPLSQKVYWHDCQTNINSHYPKRLLQTRRQHRGDHDKYLPGMFRAKRNTTNTELTNEDVDICSKYPQSMPVKSSLKKHHHYREPEVSPDEQEYSDVQSEISMKHAQYAQQSRKSQISHLRSKRYYVGGDSEYITGLRNESDVDYQQNKPDCQEIRKFTTGLEDSEKLKHDNTLVTIENNKTIEGQKLDIAKTMKEKKHSDISSCVTNKPSVMKESINKSAKELILNESVHLAKLDLYSTKNRILESIDQMLGVVNEEKNDTQRQKQTEQETVGKITRELQEYGWQLLSNALTIRDSTNSNKRAVRLECLNHIRQQLDKLYSLETTMDNCPSKQQISLNHDKPCNKEHQDSYQSLEQKVVDS